jgi:drug/metabolite transporter, DME family
LRNKPSDQATLGLVTENTHPWRGYFYVAAATFCWAAAATLGKAVFNGELFSGPALISPLLLTQARTTFTVLALAVFLLLRFGPRFFRTDLRDLAQCALLGTLGTAASNFFYYYAIQKTTVAVAITLQYTAPVWVLLYMLMRGHEQPTLRRVGAVAVALAGIALSMGLFQSHGRLTYAGAASALLASFAFAFYNIAAPGLVHRNHPLKVMLYTLLSAAVLWNILNPPWRVLAAHYNAVQGEFLFLFACLSMLLPYIFYFNGIKYLDPTRAVVACCLEPVFAVLLAAVLVGEGVGGLQVTGILAVLAATLMAQTGIKTRPVAETL